MMHIMQLKHAIGVKKCDVKEHIANRTLEYCHKKYSEMEGITNPNAPMIIMKFYKMLKDLGTALGVNSTRGDSYTARGSKRKKYVLKLTPVIAILMIRLFFIKITFRKPV